MALTAAVLSGCGGPLGSADSASTPITAPVPVAIVVEPSQLTLVSGTDGNLAAQVNDVQGAPIGGAALNYAAADPSVLRVTDTGRVTALGPATARTFVMVRSGPREARISVTVSPGAPHRLQFVAGESQELQAGAAGTAPMTLRLVDAWDNALADVPLIAESTAMESPLRFTTDAAGLAQLPLPPFYRTGAIELRIHPAAGPEPLAVARIGVRAGAPARLEVALSSDAKSDPSTTADAPGDAPIDVDLQVVDGFGNGVPGIELNVAMSGPADAATQVRTGTSGKVKATLPAPEAYGKFVIEVQVVSTTTLRQTLSIERRNPARVRKR